MPRRTPIALISASLFGIAIAAILAIAAASPSAAGQDDSSTTTTATSFDSPIRIIGAPQGLTDAVESLYLDALTGGSSDSATLFDASENLDVTGFATTAEAYGGYVGVVVASDDTILAVSDDGESWEVVEATLQSADYTLQSTAPRFVVLIGADKKTGDNRPSVLKSFADSIHIYGVDPGTREGAIVGIPRDTAMVYNGPVTSGLPRVVNGMAEISHTMRYQGPGVTAQTIADETGLPIEGWFVTSFGSRLSGVLGFEDLVDTMGGINYLNVPYAAPSQCNASPPPANPAVGDSSVDGVGALAFARERKCVPTQYLGPGAHTSNAARTLGQGLLMKAAVEMVQQPGILALPALLDIMDDFVDTNLSSTDVFTLASTLYGSNGVDPGSMPTLGPSDLAASGFAAYNRNPGDLPNVVVEGCNGSLWTDSAGAVNFNQFYVLGNDNTFRDFKDGTLNTLPVYQYNSGNSKNPYGCDAKPPSGNTFIDDDDSIFEADIEWLAAAGITKGCNPPTNNKFCPDAIVTRGQMAAFLVRALGYTDNGGGDLFIDDDDSIFEGDIDRLGTAGVTKGCNPPANSKYCPDGKVSRGQMAAFLVRALGYTDNGGGDLFIDDDDSIFEGDIDRLGTAEVTKGCNPPANTKYCPDGFVTRGQMAAFLHRALG